MSKLIRLGWSQLKTYLTTVLTDYKAVAKDVIVELEEKPWKFVLGGITYACNPTYQDFLSTVTQCRLQLLQLADLMRNERSQAHVDKLSILFNQQAIHAVNCIFFTVLLEKESLDGCDLYSVQNSLDKWTKWQDRIVDIGAFDRWFLLSKSMQNYDRREKSNKNCVWFGAQNNAVIHWWIKFGDKIRTCPGRWQKTTVDGLQRFWRPLLENVDLDAAANCRNNETRKRNLL
ncbi:Uncharacterized protein T01_11145 [Trichinella spiralis]|uniref:Uncharacterized protein n=1 Tax=Trichinella spiralis TaxID=6334 RepID=A0A0V1BPD6_TRISP|nr:Uncharacterized protein T01_11145 [Trichinella spiralis]